MKREQPQKDDRYNETPKQKKDRLYKEWVDTWMHEHIKFVAWWKVHPNSGYSENREGKSRWGILPWQAYESERYLAEYLDWSPDPVVNDEWLPKWRKERQEAEALTRDLEKRFGREFWKRMTGLQWIKGVKEVAHIMTGWTPNAMQSKIDEAYAYEPGQSEEETELLSRRRDEEGEPLI